MSTLQLPKALLPLLQDQHSCFGHTSNTNPACMECVVRPLCLSQRDRLLVEFAGEWERFTRVGAPSEMILLPSPTACSFCHTIMRPDGGKVLYVKGQGTFHPICVDQAFPPRS